ncbi:hypothetical protein IFM89_003377 [Coptis chinensis]|uniref:RING-type E3 ubiquitin transferase n=1 Tax=Coptis chinensis TaxID=261450 RepID=A0A835MBK1_9MAGN|nr:hypothetical protein IFM89_003377 [Coptis chinensis]
MVEEHIPLTVLYTSIVGSISEITGFIVCLTTERDTFMEIACYLERVTPVIMELQTTQNTLPNATETLQPILVSVNLAKRLIEKFLNTVHCITDSELRHIIEGLEGVIRNIGDSLMSIPSSTFGDEQYVETAVRALSREMQDAHFEISKTRVKERKLEITSSEELLQGEAAIIETDLYSVELSYEDPCSSKKPQLIDFLKGVNTIEQWNDGSSDDRSLKTFTQVAEYMEPIYETFYCPLTKRVMEDPVTVSSGVTYERRAITVWLNNSEDSSEDVLCPITWKKLTSRVLNTNIALKTTIEAWKERNEASRIKAARTALSLASSDSMILEALKDLQNICQKKQSNSVQMRNIGMISLLAQCLEYKDRKVRCASLEILQFLAKESDDGKEMIAKTKAITTTIKMLSSNYIPESHASLTFLLVLSVSELLCEKIGSITGAILLLITMKFNKSYDAFSSEKADNILKNLERSPKNIKCMAGNGSEETQMEMGSYLGEIVLGHDTNRYVAERASPTLMKLLQTGNTSARKAAFKALVQISSYHQNNRTIVEAGIVPILIQELFVSRVHNELMNSTEESTEILANILESGITLDNLEVNTHGHTMGSKYIVYNLIEMLKQSNSETLQFNLINIFLCLLKSSKVTSIVVSVVKETETSYTLIGLINSPHEELRTAATKLLISLTPYMGHSLADRLCKIKGQPESLIKSPRETCQITENHAVSANFLAKLPAQNLTLNLALLHKETVPTVIQTINEFQRSGTRTSRFASSYLEGLVGILVRFTTTIYEPEILRLARDHHLTAVFTELLMRTASDEVQKLSAIGLENLSAVSINLSKPPEIKRLKFIKLFRLLRFLSTKSSKNKKLALCPIHRGVCSSQSTFCLLDAKAVERLLACLDHENVQVVEAALSAICTLLDDKVDVDKSVNVLSDVNAIQHVLNVLREHREESLWQKSFWVIEKFLLKGGDSSASDISQDRFLPATLITAFHHGDVNTRQNAEKILRHLNKIPDFSAKFQQ